MFPTAAPNLTGSKIRRRGAANAIRRYQIDPYWGLPEGTPPLAVDPTTNLVRPFSSFVTLATAIDNFVGFSEEYFPPGENHWIWVNLEGIVELQLQTPAIITEGDYYTGVAVGGSVSDYLVVPTIANAVGIFRAVMSCECQPAFEPAFCPDPVPDAADVSPTAAGADRQTQRTVFLYFHSDLQKPAGA